MKKIILTFIFTFILSFSANAETYEDAFKKALENHQYYFQHKGKNYTTNTKDKPFDFFDHGYKNYREAAKYMFENYPNDNSSRCFLFKGKEWSFYGARIYKDGEWSDKFYNYLDYGEDGWRREVLANSNNNLVRVERYEDNGCMRTESYLKVFYKDKEYFNQRADYEELISEGYLLSFNINFYIDKDYNSNGKNELFIDSGYTIGINWFEHYYFFEYDDNSMKLVKDFVASDFTERLELSDHFKEMFEVSEEKLANVIYKNFSESEYVECIEGDCINGKGIFDGKNGLKYVGEFKNGKFHGQGTETLRDRFKYVGEFKDGVHHGQGTLIYVFDGDKYTGEFKDGAQEGQGTYTYSNGDKYIGEWKDGMYNGQGTKIYIDGDKYVGGWKDGRKKGKGTLTYANGTKFVGEWDEFNGIFIHEDGTKFVGEWEWERDGKPIIK